MLRPLVTLCLVCVAAFATAACLQEPAADYTVPPDGSAPSDAAVQTDAALSARDAGLDARTRAED